MSRHDGGRYGPTMAVLTFAVTVFSFQQTMVIPALPAFKQEFDTSTEWVTWLLTGFILSASVAVPLFGKLGDRYGKQRMLVVCLTVFLAGGIGAIFAWNLPALVACRMIQGSGVAVFPLSYALIKDEFPPERAPFAIGVVSSVFAVGVGLGLSASGLIVDQFGWRYLFVIGAVPVALGALLVYKVVPESTIRTPARLDVAGAVLLSVALVCLMLGLTEGNNWGWTSARVTGLFGACAVLLVVWGWVERRTAEPMVDLKMLSARTMLFTNLVTILGLLGVFATWVLVPTFVSAPNGLSDDVKSLVQYGFGSSSTVAGLYLLPGTALGLIVGPYGARFGQRYGAKLAIVLGLTISAAGLVALTVWHDRSWQVIVGATVLCTGIPIYFASIATLVVGAVRATETGVATAMNTVMRMIGQVLGAQLGAAVLTADTIAGTDVPKESAFAWVFGGSAAVTVGAVAVSFLITPVRRRLPAVAAVAEGAE